MSDINVTIMIQSSDIINHKTAIIMNGKEGIPMKILIVEDDEMIADFIALGLRKAGYECSCVYDGSQAAVLLESTRYDLLLLDIMLPGVNGYELIEYVKDLEVPVIFITAKSRLEDKLKGLKLGADDYITKPFELAELTARVEAVLRRYYKSRSTLRLFDLEIDAVSRTVKRGENMIELSMKEFDLLLLFLRNRNIALFRDRIYEEVWGGEFDPESRTVDMHVQRVKRKLGLDHAIVSVRKIGYRLEVTDR